MISPFLESEVNAEGDFYSSFINQLKIQSGNIEDGSGEGAHPDETLRTCLKGLYRSLTKDANPFLKRLISELPQKRNHIDSTHLADLIARCVQHMFRTADDPSYLNYSESEWQQYFKNLSSDKLDELSDLLVNREVATHVMSRYRGLAAISHLRTQALNSPVAVADIGCCLNFGLQAAVKGFTIEDDLGPFTDLTPDELILNSLQARQSQYAYALGVDIQEPDFDWVLSCAYFSKYEKNRETLLRHKRLLETDQSNGIPIHSLVADIASENIVSQIKELGAPKFDIIYASMMMYQLSPTTQETALKNIHHLTQSDGVFVELTFKNPQNWFLPWNAVTTVRFWHEQGFSKPLQWVEWDSSRCLVAQEGKDYERVNSLLLNL